MWSLLLAVIGAVIILCLLPLLSYLGRRRNRRTPSEVADFIENFLEGRGEVWDWDEFTTLPIYDPDLDRIRKRCLEIPDVYPPGKDETYCGPEGEHEMRQMVAILRGHGGAR